MAKEKKDREKEKKIHFFLSGEDAKKIKILQEAIGTRFATDIVKQALDIYLFYIWLQTKRFKQFAKLVEEFRRDVERNRKKSRRAKVEVPNPNLVPY